jgi:hypothetical protein
LTGECSTAEDRLVSTALTRLSSTHSKLSFRATVPTQRVRNAYATPCDSIAQKWQRRESPTRQLFHRARGQSDWSAPAGSAGTASLTGSPANPCVESVSSTTRHISDQLLFTSREVQSGVASCHVLCCCSPVSVCTCACTCTLLVTQQP